MRTFFRRTDWRYWAGTIDDLLKPAESAVDYIRRRTEDRVPFEATVTLPGQQIDTDSVTELRESIRDHDVPNIDSITIKIGTPGTLRIDLDVHRGWKPVILRTKGTDEIAVNGLHSTIAAELDRGRRRITYEALLALRITTGVLVGFVLPILIASSGGITSIPTDEIGYDFLGAYQSSELKGEWWAFVSLFTLPVLGIAIAFWGHTFAIRDLELLRPGETTRYEQVRGLVWVALLTLVIGPLAGIAWTLFLRQ